MDKLLEEIMPEVWKKYFKHIPKDSDLTLIVLKGHLLVEEELNKLIDIIFYHPEHLKKSRITFFQTYKIVMAMYYKENRAWLWGAIEKLNAIRNKYAHNLEPNDIEINVQELNELVCNAIHTRELSIDGRLRHSIAMILSMLNDIKYRGYAI